MESLPINVTDVVVVLVIVVSGVFAVFRGLVHELLSVVSWVGAAVATLYGFPYVQPEARRLITIQLIADMAAGIAIFLVVFIVLSILTRLLSRRVRDSSFGPLDRSLGLVFGLLRGAVLVCVAWLALAWVLPREDHPQWLAKARSLPLVERGGEALIALLPERLRLPTAERPAGAAGPSFENLLTPQTKGGADADQPGYNSHMREEMRRAVEAATQSTAGPNKGAQ